MSQTNITDDRLPYQGYPYTKPIITEIPSDTPEVATVTTSRTDQKTPYRGFPYVNRTVTDAPTLSPAEVAALAKWHNLPRRQLCQSSRDERYQVQESPPNANAEDTSPVVYAEVSKEPTPAPSRPATSKLGLDPDRPAVYIDIPHGSSDVLERRTDHDDVRPNGIMESQGGSSYQFNPSKSNKDLELDRPMVYIDIPQNDGSEVSQVNEEEEPAYVQDTILYDQFKDARIELPSISCDSDSESQGSGASRPYRPNTLNIGTPGSFGFGSTPSSLPNSSYSNNYQNKEVFLYGQTPTSNDEFPLTPLPVNDFPAYPPRYEEIIQTPVTEQPRTQVIINPASPVRPMNPVMPDRRRKMLTCQHCNTAVQTLVIAENGFYTHLIALFAFIIFLPLVIYVYWADCAKYQTHYCPQCNKKIGHEDPSRHCNDDMMTYIS